MSYEQGKVMNFKHGHKLLETVDQHKAEIGTVAKNWEDHKTEAFAVGEYVIKDNVTYRFKAAHAANTAWNASEVEETNLGSEITGLKSAIGTVPTGKTVQGQIEALQTGKADMIVVTDSTPAEVMTFPDGADEQPMALKVAVEPVQDLHGYANPWPAGGGKNLLQVTATTQTIDGVTFTVNSDGTVIANGTATSFVQFELISWQPFPAGTYILNGSPSVSGVSIYVNPDRTVAYSDVGSGVQFSVTSEIIVRISVDSGTQLSNVLFKPMIRLASDTDPYFTPCSNICPISGWTGADVSRTGKNWYSSANEQDARGTSGTEWSSAERCRTKDYIRVEPNTKYTIHCFGDPTIYAIVNNYYDEHKNLIGAVENQTIFTTPAGANYVRFTFGKQGGSAFTPANITELMLEKGDSYTAYEPFGQVYDVSFPSEAGTVYGGTLTLNQDGTGSLVVDTEIETYDGSVDESFSMASHSASESTYRFYITKKPVVRDAGICNRFSKIPFADRGNDIIGFAVGTEETHFRYTTPSVADFKTWLSNNPVQVLYKLTTPVTYTLTAPQIKTLLGVNNVWADTGNIESVTYPADTKLYIDKLIANLQALVLENISNT